MRRNIRVKKRGIGAGLVSSTGVRGGYAGTPRFDNGGMYVSTAYPTAVFAFDPGNPGRIRRQPRPKPVRLVRPHAACPSRAGVAGGP
jgi:hypothetical protein